MMRSRTKSYRPKPINPIGGLGVIDRRNRIDDLKTTLNDEQLADLGIAYRLAYEAMVSGHASEQAWATVVGSLNIALVLSDHRYGADYQTTFNAALAAAWRSKQRFDRCGAWGFDGDGQQAIKRALAAHDAQVEEAPKHALIAAINEVHRRYSSGDNYQ